MITKIGQYALIIRNKRILILYTLEGDIIGIPGGRLKPDETDPLKGLEREVEEETGLKIKNADPFDVRIFNIPGRGHRYGVFFLCDVDRKEIKLSDEHKGYRWSSYEELIKDFEKFPEIAELGKDVINKLRGKGLI